MEKENGVAVVSEAGKIPTITYTREQLDLIKRVYAKDASDDELALFVYAAKRLKLDILARQIHFTKRQGKPVFIVAIDGYRLNAERTDRYAPGREPTFTYNEDGSVKSATSYVKKFIAGTWHEIAATAFMAEYKPDNESSGFMWRKMPHNQLAKCAEALALRRAFPNELGDTITEEEAAQQREPEAVNEPPMPRRKSDPKPAPEPVEAEIIDQEPPPVENEAPVIDEPAQKESWLGDKDLLVLEFIPVVVTTKDVDTRRGKATKYAAKDQQGRWYSTFDEGDGERLVYAKDEKRKVKIVYKVVNGFYNIEKVYDPQPV